MADIFGFNPPFYDGAFNIMPRQEDERIVKNDILQLLNTVPGERLYRPNYGIGLRNYLFEQLDTTTVNQLQNLIYTQISTYEPRIINLAVSVEQDDARNGLNIKITCSLANQPNTFIDIEQFFARG